MKRTFKILILAIAILGSVGCSKKMSAKKATTVDPSFVFPQYPPVVDEDVASGGAEVELTLDSKTELDNYMGWVSCDPTDAKVAINLKPIANYTGEDTGFGGTVTIKFKDRGAACGDPDESFDDRYSSLIYNHPTNTRKNNKENHVYNLRSKQYPERLGKKAFHGFFEASVRRLVLPMKGAPIFGGSLILVIDEDNDSNDGGGPTQVSGSVYYYNMMAQHPMAGFPATNCWFVSAGPYDCRAWAKDGGVNTKASLYPNGDSSYVRLGTFTGLDVKKAFNGSF